MQPIDPTPAQGTDRPLATASGVTALLGKVLAFGLIVAAGGAGWVAADKYGGDLLEPRVDEPTTALAAALPELGDGLPSARLDAPAPWRRFSLTYIDDARSELYWFDLDTWKLSAEIIVGGTSDFTEIDGDRGFRRTGANGEWIEQDVETTRQIASYVMGGIGPFVLTDLVPPETLGFTTLELEGTSRGERVYEVAVDADTLRATHPLAYERWVTTTRIVGGGSGVYRIRVRPDGYIVRIDGETSSLEWSDLRAVEFTSPIADPVPAPQPTVPLQPVVDASIPLTPTD